MTTTPTADQELTADCSSIVDQYVFSSTIHGVREQIFNKSNSLPSRCIWMLIVLSCFGLCCFEMFRVYADFQNNPTVIQIAPFKPASYPYPLVRYCPKSWLNLTKVRDLGIEDSVLIYSLSLLSQLLIPKNWTSQFRNASMTEMDSIMKSIMADNSWTDYFDMYLGLAKDIDAVVQCSQCKDDSIRPVVTSIGVCFDLEFQDYPWLTTYYADLPCVGFSTFIGDNETEHDHQAYYDTIFATDVVFMGEHPRDFFGWDPLFLNPGHTHAIELKPTHRKRLPMGNTSQCFSNPKPEYSDKMCGSECAERIFGAHCWRSVHLGHIGATPEGDSSKHTDLPWHSSVFSNQSSEVKRCENQYMNQVIKCAKKCLSPCEIWEYDRSVQLVPYCRLNDSSINESLELGGHRLEFIYLGAEGTLVEELSIVNANIFISNMGCQLGLWFGGSAVSMVQILVFVFNMINRLSNREMKD